MYRLTYQDNYHVERTLEYKDYEELNDKVIYQGLVGDLYRFLSQVHFSDKN